MDLTSTEFHLKEMRELFGDQLPNHEHYPIQFAYFVKLYSYYIKRKESRGALIPTG